MGVFEGSPGISFTSFGTKYPGKLAKSCWYSALTSAGGISKCAAPATGSNVCSQAAWAYFSYLSVTASAVANLVRSSYENV